MMIPPGTSLGDYEILEPLGAGGMGEVYLARDRRLGRRVAIKVLPGALTLDAHRVARFEQEARSASLLSHPNICVIHALGETSDGRKYIAMEHVEGVTLRARLGRGPLSVDEALAIAVQLATGVAAAHGAGIVHRDLKPDNVIVRPDGLVKILDFGLAKLGAEGHEGATLTRAMPETDPGTVLGTVLYMAPEQARGQDVDARADLWALGVIVYELVAGRVPFSGPSNSDIIAAILQNEPLPLARFDPAVPAELQRIVTKALRKHRDQRYQTAKDLALDLQALADELRLHPSVASEAIAPREARSAEPLRANEVSTPRELRSGERLRASEASAPHQSSAEYILTTIGHHKLASTLVGAGLLAGAALVVWWIGRSPVPISSPAGGTQPNYTRLTFGPGLQTDVTFSPDGRFIAYASDRSGNFDIWVQPVAGGDPVQVTKSPAQDTEPDWSPDGSTLVFSSDRASGGLYTVPALGGPERQIATFGACPRWSRDGKEVLFLSSRSIDAGMSRIGLFSVSPEGEPPRPLLASVLDQGMWLWAGAHPDGRISLIGESVTLGIGFFTMKRDGTGIVQSKGLSQVGLEVDAQGVSPARFEWNDTGTALFLEMTVKGVQNLWRVDVDPQTLEWKAARRLTLGPGHDGKASLSRDGLHIGYTTWTDWSRLWSFPRDPVTGAITGAGTPVSEDQAEVLGSDLAPDGHSLAYALTRQGAASPELHLADLNSGANTTLPVGPDLVPQVVWSRDSRRLAFNLSGFAADGWPENGRLVIRSVDSGAQQVRPMRAGTLFQTCDWTPDGQGILGTYYGRALPTDVGGMAFWQLDGPKTSLRPEPPVVSFRDAVMMTCRLSADGMFVAWLSARRDRPGETRLAVTALSNQRGGGSVDVASDHEHPDKPRFTPDGRLLYFLSRKSSSFYNLWATKFDAGRGTPVGAPFQVSHFDSPQATISPWLLKSEIGISEHRAVLTMRTVTGSIWMLDAR